MKWYFTFGIVHPMTNYVIEIEGDFDEAREQMHDVFGRNWCGQYDPQEWAEFVEEWGIKEVIRFE